MLNVLIFLCSYACWLSATSTPLCDSQIDQQHKLTNAKMEGRLAKPTFHHSANMHVWCWDKDSIRQTQKSKIFSLKVPYVICILINHFPWWKIYCNIETLQCWINVEHGASVVVLLVWCELELNYKGPWQKTELWAALNQLHYIHRHSGTEKEREIKKC